MDKTPLGVRIFDRIADKYEFTAKFLSFGIMPYWLRQLVKGISPKGKGKVLDLACGTGILFPHLVERFDLVVGLDYSFPMLREAKKKNLQRVRLVRGNALFLPFGEAVFDTAVVSLGLRHFPDIELSLRELFRVLKEGGELHILEVGIPENPLLGKLFLAFLKGVVLPLGRLRAKEEVYEHLFGSIVKFPHRSGLVELLQKVGFSKAEYEPVMGGIVYIYRAVK